MFWRQVNNSNGIKYYISVCLCVHRYTWESHQDDRLQLYLAGHLIIPHVIEGGISKNLPRFQEANLPALVDVEEMVQYQDKASNLKRLQNKKTDSLKVPPVCRWVSPGRIPNSTPHMVTGPADMLRNGKVSKWYSLVTCCFLISICKEGSKAEWHISWFAWDSARLHLLFYLLLTQPPSPCIWVWISYMVTIDSSKACVLLSPRKRADQLILVQGRRGPSSITASA